MKRSTTSPIAALLAAAMLASCGGGGGGSSTLPNAPGKTNKTAQVKMTLRFNKNGGTAVHHRNYVSRATAGVGISWAATPASPALPGSTLPQTQTAMRSPMLAENVQAGYSDTNISCSAADSTGAYSCSVLFPASAGISDFQITTWDQAPSAVGLNTTPNNVFPTANNLSTNDELAQLIALDQLNQFNLSLDGIVASVYMSLTPNTLLDGQTNSSVLQVFAKDADGNVIIGNDPYVDVNGSPVIISVNDSLTFPPEYVRFTLVDGSGNETLPSNEQTTVLAISGKTVLGSPAGNGTAVGYNVYASGASGNELKVTQTPIPLGTDFTLTSNDATYGSMPVSNGTGGGITDPGAATFGSIAPTTPATVTLGTSSFTSPATQSTTVSYNGGDVLNAVFTGSTTNAAPINSATLAFTRTTVPGVGVGASVPTINLYNASQPSGSFTSAFGSLWAMDLTGTLRQFSPGGALMSTTAEGCCGGPIAAGADGYLWYAESSSQNLHRIDPTSPTTEANFGPVLSGSPNSAMLLDPVGDLWVASGQNGASYYANQVVPAKNGALPPTINGGCSFTTNPTAIATDGTNLYFGDSSSGSINVTPVAGPCSLTPYTVPGLAPGAIDGIAVDNTTNHNLWIAAATRGLFETDHSGNVLLSLNSTTTPAVNGIVNSVVTGPDGNIYFTETGVENAVLRVNPSTQQLVKITQGISGGSAVTFTSPNFATVGPDNNIWFTDGSNVDQLVL